MRKPFFLLLLGAALLATSFSTRLAPTAENDSTAADETLLRTALLSADNNGLIHFLRLRAQPETSRDKINQLIQALKSPRTITRQQAAAQLITIGTPALPLLRAAARDGQTHAQFCVQTIQADGGTLTAAAIRLLVQRRPPGIARVLLDYLPHAENDLVREELQNAFNTLAYHKGVADPVVVQALSDKHPLRRLNAVVALMQDDRVLPQDQLRPLLRDPAALVRLHTALALARTFDPQAITTLIALLGELSGPAAHEAEDCLSDLAGDSGPKVELGDDSASREKARAAWAKWWQDSKGLALLEELKKHTLPETELDKVQELIRKMGDENFEVRREAEKKLIGLGVPILSPLRQALKHPPDLEVRLRVQSCIGAIEGANQKVRQEFYPRIPPLARLIALHKQPGAAAVILAYLPFLDDESLLEELQEALNAVAFVEGKVEPVVLQRLTDKRSAVRRAAAAEALCSQPEAGYLEEVRKLLSDSEPSVRLKVALALARARDKTAVPVLITLVGSLSTEQSAQAEEYLSQLARESKPKDLPEGAENRVKRSKLWSAWWEANKDTVVLVGAPPRERVGSAFSRSVRGYTLLVQTRANMVTELGPDGKPRWTLTGLMRPVDAQVLSDQRVLVAELSRVTERDLSGKILWQKEGLPGIASVLRLQNGNTLITCNGQNTLLEVDRKGQEVMRVQIPLNVSFNATARRLRDGRIVLFTNGRDVVQMDKMGRVVKTTQVPGGGLYSDVLDNGHVLVPMGNAIIEYDGDGKQVHRIDVANAGPLLQVSRLSNGHILATIQRQPKCLELNKNGKIVKETTLPGRAFRAFFRVKRR